MGYSRFVFIFTHDRDDHSKLVFDIDIPGVAGAHEYDRLRPLAYPDTDVRDYPYAWMHALHMFSSNIEVSCFFCCSIVLHYL